MKESLDLGDGEDLLHVAQEAADAEHRHVHDPRHSGLGLQPGKRALVQVLTVLTPLILQQTLLAQGQLWKYGGISSSMGSFVQMLIMIDVVRMTPRNLCGLL